MIIDCDTCQVRGLRCGDCVVTVLLSRPPVSPEAGPTGTDLDPSEQAALAALADGGLIPPLRLVSGERGM